MLASNCYGCDNSLNRFPPPGSERVLGPPPSPFNGSHDPRFSGGHPHRFFTYVVDCVVDDVVDCVVDSSFDRLDCPLQCPSRHLELALGFVDSDHDVFARRTEEWLRQRTDAITLTNQRFRDGVKFC